MSFCTQLQCWQSLPCCLHRGQQFSIANGAFSWLQDLAAARNQSLSEVVVEMLELAQKQSDQDIFGEIRCLWCDNSRVKTKIAVEIPLKQTAWLGEMGKKHEIRTLGKTFRCVLDYAMSSDILSGDKSSIQSKSAVSLLSFSTIIEVIGTAQDLCNALNTSRESLEVHMFQVWNEQRQAGLQGQTAYKISSIDFSDPLLSIEFQSEGKSWTFSIEEPEVCMFKILSREQKMFAITISQATSIEETNPSRSVTFDRGATAPAPADRMMYDKPAMYVSGVFP